MNYPQMTPYLICKDLDASLAWFDKIGFKQQYVMRDSQSGHPIHAEIQKDGMHFMMGSLFPGMEYQPPSSATGHYVVLGGKDYDLDGLCEELKGKGIEVCKEPMTQFYGHRTFTIRHPEGFEFTLGKLVQELSDEEMQANLKQMMASASA